MNRDETRDMVHNVLGLSGRGWNGFIAGKLEHTLQLDLVLFSLYRDSNSSWSSVEMPVLSLPSAFETHVPV